MGVPRGCSLAVGWSRPRSAGQSLGASEEAARTPGTGKEEGPQPGRAPARSPPKDKPMPSACRSSDAGARGPEHSPAPEDAPEQSPRCVHKPAVSLNGSGSQMRAALRPRRRRPERKASAEHRPESAGLLGSGPYAPRGGLGPRPHPNSAPFFTCCSGGGGGALPGGGPPRVHLVQELPGHRKAGAGRA